jgi:hypothetical protein
MSLKILNNTTLGMGTLTFRFLQFKLTKQLICQASYLDRILFYSERRLRRSVPCVRDISTTLDGNSTLSGSGTLIIRHGGDSGKCEYWLVMRMRKRIIQKEKGGVGSRLRLSLLYPTHPDHLRWGKGDSVNITSGTPNIPRINTTPEYRITFAL